MKKDNHGLGILICAFAIFIVIAVAGLQTENYLRKHHPDWWKQHHPESRGGEMPSLLEQWKQEREMGTKVTALPPVFEMHVLQEQIEQAREEAQRKEADRRQERSDDGRATDKDYDRQADYIRDHCG